MRKRIVFIEEKVRQLNNGRLIQLLVDFDLFELKDDGDIITLNREELIQKLVTAALRYDLVARRNCSQEEEGHGSYVLDLWTDCWRFA